MTETFHLNPRLHLASTPEIREGISQGGKESKQTRRYDAARVINAGTTRPAKGQRAAKRPKPKHNLKRILKERRRAKR